MTRITSYWAYLNRRGSYLTGRTAPIRNNPNVTAGLNAPPLTRKKAQTLVAKLAPKAAEIHRTFAESVPSCFGFRWLAVCTVAKLKKRNKKVPKKKTPRLESREDLWIWTGEA